MVIETFHFVNWDEPGRRDARALCGRLVDRYREHDNAPNCSLCARLLAERNRGTAAEVFGDRAPGTPVPSTLADPLKDYREKGAGR